MNWTAYVDGYCERVAPGLWGEPLNAVTNLAFIFAAIWVWPRVAGDAGARLLCGVLASIGVASGLFHTLANQWSGAADSLSILVFILIYVYLAGRRILGLSPVLAGASVLGFFPYAIGASFLIATALGPLNGSVPYVSVALLIAIYGAIAWRARPDIARGLFVGAAILCVSITARSVDEAVCGTLPFGTHFLWHCLNAIMLGWMITVIHRIGGRESLAG